MKGIEVVLREASEAEGSVLCRVAYDELDALIAEMKRWRVIAGSDPTDDLAGQFVLNGHAYFEIIVGGAEG